MAQTLQYVSSRLSMLQIDEEDLERNAQFGKVLIELCPLLGPNGGSANLNRELEETRRELLLQRKMWMRSEVIYQLVQEMLLDLQVRKLEGSLTEEERKFQDGLQQCMLVSECSRLLTADSVPPSDSTSILGLDKQDLLDLLPPNMLVLWVRDRLQKQLEEALKKKCFTFLSFHQPETDEEGDVLRAAKVLRLASTLEDEKRRLQNEQEKHQEMRALLEKQQEIYPHVLLRCLSLLRQAASELRLRAQSDIDRINAEYLEAKSNALFLKLRMEELQVLTDCYTPEKVLVHRQIRDTLEAGVKKEKQELSTSRQILSSYEFLGPEFEGLVQEYTRLKDKIKDNRWMLQELSKSLP
ncbi:HAUS augmin like complex subunit 4 L homeolog [Xenopus laevis]|uniref:HAUS augmin like complex subunit 4 L homeolog n=1 Tax=Xenopus laevis TaxID=8355 RepID=Q4V7I1_XENLA|nr:HAUS augmin like complex subunit 4 L homeolog [Xenopus laevis]8AT2_D Chain D, HAUS augmin like complex subunit 4 L homeolog [Xenopus laevis]8AT3_C Chain C, HAUS augmin like complex subunit 4 L homeolog [Xenopus laevis]8AT4_C Chain C, HAUS augmin like complex subunit 4 L homeolog [Xenopus laevis]8FCK_C Chain C, HAUS augmin like complex subunit 4 L homeolog [Xenopus laevis]AAH97897.1 MGC115689 protein [Xenopus laevis]